MNQLIYLILYRHCHISLESVIKSSLIQAQVLKRRYRDSSKR